MAIRSLSQIVNDAVSFIQSKIATLSLLPGTVARDVVVEAPAQEFSLIWTELDRVERQQLYSDPTAFLDTELTTLASSLGLQRNNGLAATGTVTFRLTSFSTSSTDIIIPAGTEVATAANISSNNVVTFLTTAEGDFIASVASTYFNPSTGFYEVTVPIQATGSGTTGNVPAGLITVLSTTIAGSPTVINMAPTTGGTDAESNAALLTRIRQKLSGTAMGTPNGILSFVNSNANVIESILVGPGDPNLVRSEFGNAADVVLIGEIATPITETRTFIAGQSTYVLAQQPLLDSAAPVNSIIPGVVGGTGFNFIEGVHFNVSIDNSSLARGSTRATSSIVFLGSPFPDPNSAFTISYSVNSLIQNLQVSLSSDDNRIVGTDILVRYGIKVLVRVGAFITVFPGFTKANVAAAAVTNVTNLLNSAGLNSDFSESQIIAAIQDTPGVASVLIPISLEVKRPTDPSFISTSTISVSEIEYVRPDSSPNAIAIT